MATPQQKAFCILQDTEMGEMGETCSTHGGDGKCVFKMWLETLDGRNNLEDPALDGKIILNGT
jgi:hypothetical protein